MITTLCVIWAGWVFVLYILCIYHYIYLNPVPNIWYGIYEYGIVITLYTIIAIGVAILPFALTRG